MSCQDQQQASNQDQDRPEVTKLHTTSITMVTHDPKGRPIVSVVRQFPESLITALPSNLVTEERAKAR